MPTKPFHYQEMFPLGPDTTEYRLITKDHVKVENWNGHEMLVVDPEARTIIANAPSHDCSF
ncbi:MAG: fumarate hydratase, partial [Muribaculaceae bacterium]|nr:fumarate hydratase [Muribaculaceae bacterium]